jgi:hypothetical protein
MVSSADGPDELERELRDRLRGRRIVFEMGLDAETVTRAGKAVAELAESHWGAAVIAERFPAVLVTYIVGEANARYEHGSLWPRLPVSFPTSELRGAFEHAVDTLGLEPFDQLADEGLRYVTPILAHGGIPRFSATDFWRLLINELDEVPGADADELMRRWRSRPTAFEHIDKPVGRFLLNGGDVAGNFVDRCIDLATSPKSTTAPEGGLPNHVVEAFRSFASDEGARHVRRARAVPPPRLMLDPWDRAGPFVELPGVSPEIGGASWVIRTGLGIPSEIVASRDRQHVAVDPADSWHVDFSSWTRVRPFDFEGTAGTLVFDPRTGACQTVARAIVLDEAWILEPLDAVVEVESQGRLQPPTVTEFLPALGGAWGDYVLRRVDLTGVQSIKCTRGDGTNQVLRVVPSDARVRLSGDHVLGVATSTGEDVFSRAPHVSIPNLSGVTATRWTIQVRAGQRNERRSASELGGISNPIDVAPLLPDGYLGEVQLAVIGPLGFDLRATFAVAPGLRIKHPSRLLLPGERGQVDIEVDEGIAINAGANRMAIPISSDDSGLNVTLRQGQDELAIRVWVAHLTWAIQGSARTAALATDPIDLEAAELLERRAQAVVIATEQSGLAVWLALRDGGSVIHQTATARTSGERGRWRFQLDQFSDSLTKTDAAIPELTLEIDGRSVVLARVRARVSATDFFVQLTTEEDAKLLLGFAEQQVVRHRVAMLWSLDRPWEAPVRSRIPDGISGRAYFRPEDVPAGLYRAQVTIVSDWLEPERPERGHPNTRDLLISGTPRPAREIRHLLALALQTGRRPAGLTDNVIAGHTRELVAAVDVFVSDAPAGSIPFRATAAARLLLETAPCYAELIAASARGELSHVQFVRLVVLGLPLIGLAEELPDDIIGALWPLCPALAARRDIPAARANDQRAQRRCRDFLGWTPGASLPEAMPGIALGPWLSSSPAEIRAKAQALRVDGASTAIGESGYNAATFEWIANAQDSPSIISEWWIKYGQALSKARPGADERMRKYIARRGKSRALPDTAGLAQATLASADRLIARDDEEERARAALHAAADFAPSLVAHDLTLALLLRGAGADERVPERAISSTSPQSVPVHQVGSHESAAPPTVSSEEALQRLLAWRHDVMEHPPLHHFYLFTSHELERIAERRPRTVADFGDLIRNPDKLMRHGHELIRAIWQEPRRFPHKPPAKAR